MKHPLHASFVTYKQSGAIVPALWAAYNGMFLAILGGMGGTEIPLLLYGGSITIMEIIGIVIIMARWHSPATGQRYRLPSRGEAGIVGALALTLLALAEALGPWLYPPGGVTLCWAVMIAYKDHQVRKALMSGAGSS